MQTLQEYAYRHISRSLLKADRLTFAMHLSHGMHQEMFQENEWELFTGILVSANTGQDSGSLPSWIDENRRPAVARLKGQFPHLYETLQLDSDTIWGGFARLEKYDLINYILYFFLNDNIFRLYINNTR